MRETAMTRKKILIVDDEEHILRVLSMKLRTAGYEPIVAMDGDEGLAIARRELPALIITDQQMPHLTGLELGRALGEHPETAGIPVLMLTARGHSLERAAMVEAHIRALVAKPFSPRSILKRIDELVHGGRPEAA